MSRKPRQYAALPYREAKKGRIEVLLITSRGAGRWLIPKGWPMKGRKPHETAAREAYEEAGAVGRPDRRPVGVYAGRKRMNGSRIRCHIEVYPLPVSRLKANWPESAERVRKWFDVKKAAALVDEPGLESLILAISGR